MWELEYIEQTMGKCMHEREKQNNKWYNNLKKEWILSKFQRKKGIFSISSSQTLPRITKEANLQTNLLRRPLTIYQSKISTQTKVTGHIPDEHEC